MQQPNVTNGEAKTITKKCILSYVKILIWGFHYMIVEEAGFLCCYAVWLGNFVPTFWRNLLPSPSWIWVNSRTHNPGDEGGTFLRNVGNQLPSTLPNNPEDLFPQYDNVLAINKIRAVVLSGQSGNLPATLAVSFVAVVVVSLSLSLFLSLFLSLSLYIYTYIAL
jgi:hypothetical protein